MESCRKFISYLIEKKLLCDEYASKLEKTYYSKAGMFDLLCDSNGFNYLQELQMKGVETPYEYINTFFERYVNGKYTYKATGENGEFLYDGRMYCCFDDTLFGCVSLLSILKCNCKIIVPKFSSLQIAIDGNSSVEISSDETSDVKCTVYGNCSVKCDTDFGIVKIRKITK